MATELKRFRLLCQPDYMNGVDKWWAMSELRNELERTEKTLDRLITLHKETADALDFNAAYLEALRAEIAIRRESREVVTRKPVTFAGIS